MLRSDIENTYLAWVDVHEHGHPVLASAHGIVCQDLAYARLARVLWSKDEDARRIRALFPIAVWKRRAVYRGQRTHAHSFEGHMNICVGYHGRLVGDILDGGMACDVLAHSER